MGEFERPATGDRDSVLLRKLDRILGHIQGFPIERFAKMESELQQLKGMVQEEARTHRALAEESHRLALGVNDTIEKQLDRAFATCRHDRDLLLERLSDRISYMETRQHEERRQGIQTRLAIFGAAGALVISVVTLLLRWVLEG